MSAYYVQSISFGPVAQWIEQLPSKQLVVGSIPARATIFVFRASFASRQKANPDFGKCDLPVRSFSFCGSFFPLVKKRDAHCMWVAYSPKNLPAAA